MTASTGWGWGWDKPVKRPVHPALGLSSTQQMWLPPAQFSTTSPTPTWSQGAVSPPASAGPVLICRVCRENTPEGQQGKGEQGDPLTGEVVIAGGSSHHDTHFTVGVTEALLAPGFTSRLIRAQSRCSFSSTRIPLWFCLQMQCGSPWAWRRTHRQKPSGCSAQPGTPLPTLTLTHPRFLPPPDNDLLPWGALLGWCSCQPLQDTGTGGRNHQLGLCLLSHR